MLPTLLALTAHLTFPSTTDVVTVRGRTTIDRSCDVRVASVPRGEPGEGVVLVTGDDVTLRFLDELDGTAPGDPLDRAQGVGIRITGKNVTLRGATVRGFKVAIHAEGADGLVLEDCVLEGNFAQALGSTPVAEDSADWLWPHANDGHEWTERYGAAIHVERSHGVTVRRCRARRGQNGLILDRVTGSRVYDNDFSFLSGWGLALWRSSDNVVSRNALDFCVRGYSHGVYNRGQDSAGILMFEQCERNVIAENSATHSGDGFFAFSGKEALGEHPAPREDFDYARRGNVDNLIVGNDFSHAVAHGLELTFAFGNVILGNRMVGNAICGIWGGYSKDTTIAGNHFERNGDMPYGLERGGINIEHGERNVIVANTFVENACGVHLWWDPDEGLTKLPWSKANGHGCGATRIAGNRFTGDEIAVQLRDCPDVRIEDNDYEGVGVELAAEEHRPAGDAPPAAVPDTAAELHRRLGGEGLPGETRPVGARGHLAGREHIVMTTYGPYDWKAPRLQFVRSLENGGHEYRLLGATDDALPAARLEGGAELTTDRDGRFPLYRVEPGAGARFRASPYRLSVDCGPTKLVCDGVLLPLRWEVRSFAWTRDPREDLDGWLEEARGAHRFEVGTLEFAFGNAGPSQLAAASAELAAADLPHERFGTLARTEIRLPAGRWKLATTSDDGIRVAVDGEVVIDDWTWHPPKDHTAVFELAEEREVVLDVRHFELDGYAVLKVRLDRAE